MALARPGPVLTGRALERRNVNGHTLMAWVSSAAMFGPGIAGASVRPVTIADLDERELVTDAQVSPDGKSVLYAVTRSDSTADTKRTGVWRVSWSGGAPQRLSGELESATAPRWSPDGRWISFLKTAEGSPGMQLWLLAGTGGEARRVTDVPGGITGYAWAPDGRRLVLVHSPVDRQIRNANAVATPVPWVIDRYRFKIDEGEGYLHAGWNPPRLHLHDLQTGASEALTAGQGFEEADPAWSPDGRHIAFVSHRGPDRDRTDCTDVFIVEARAGAVPRRLTDFPGMDAGPLSWNRGGTEISFRQGGEPRYWMFEQLQLAVVSAKGGPPQRLTDGLDRDISHPVFSSGKHSVLFLVVDNRTRYPARLSRQSGRIERLFAGPHKIVSFTEGAGHIAVVATSDDTPAEIFALEHGALRQLTHHNEAWRNGVEWAPVEEIDFAARDGERVYGLLTRPLGYQPGRRYPTILWIHGGPYLQDEHGFTDHSTYDPRQLFAANGYAVLQVNYRGSRGRGARFGRGTFADWGNQDVADLLAGVDQLVAAGIADPDRLGVGGWSFGGFLTDYLIVSDTRFKAAISGAGSGSKLSLYGSDLYANPNELEFGAPWDRPEVWLRISRPLLQANRARTPTLFIGGEKDFNVPIAGSEQMYQALKSLRVPTQLVIYPGEHHMVERPSFERDLLRRYLEWYARYLQERPGT